MTVASKETVEGFVLGNTSPISRADELKNLGEERGLSATVVLQAVWRLIARGALVLTRRRSLYNPAQPYLPGFEE